MTVPDRAGIVYLQAMPFPSDQTHTIQIARTVAALGELTDVWLFVGQVTVPPDELAAAVERTYGVRFGPRVRVATAPGGLGRWSFPFTLARLVRGLPANAVFYTRSFPIAQRLVRTRSLHRRRVFFESHKKAGYYREDPVIDSPYRAIRDAFERQAEGRSVLSRLYADVDGTFFLHRHSLEAVLAAQSVRRATHLWYGWREVNSGRALGPPGDRSSSDRAGAVYCGSIAESKLFEVVVEALDLTRGDHSVSVFGAEPDRVAAVQRRFAGRVAARRLAFHDRVPPARLPAELTRYRHGIAVQEGLKVIDYFENGVIPIVPDLPSYRDEIDERHALWFKPDDARSLADCLDRAGCWEPDWNAIAELGRRYSFPRRAETIMDAVRAE